MAPNGHAGDDSDAEDDEADAEEDGGNGGANESKQFPARDCPKCRLAYVACDLCGAAADDGPQARKISRFKAAIWYASHPEYHDTEREFPAVKPPDSGSSGDK